MFVCDHQCLYQFPCRCPACRGWAGCPGGPAPPHPVASPGWPSAPARSRHPGSCSPLGCRPGWRWPGLWPPLRNSHWPVDTMNYVANGTSKQWWRLTGEDWADLLEQETLPHIPGHGCDEECGGLTRRRRHRRSYLRAFQPPTQRDTATRDPPPATQSSLTGSS